MSTPTIAMRRHTVMGVASVDAAAAALSQIRWLTIAQQQVPIASQLQRPLLPSPPLPPRGTFDAEQLSQALHREAPDLLNAYTQRFARDIGYGLSALHNGERRVYLGLSLQHVQFNAPATFCLQPFAGERAMPPECCAPVLAGGTPGYAPEDQLLGAASAQDTALVAIDAFAWAASVCAFALGEPLVPVWPTDGEPAAWVQHIFVTLGVDINGIRDADEKTFFAHWALDHACSLVTDAHAEEQRCDAAPDDGSPETAAHRPLSDLLQTLGAPWPALPQRLGPLFPTILAYFDLQWRSRPPIETLLSHLEVRREWPAPRVHIDLPQRLE